MTMADLMLPLPSEEEKTNDLHGPTPSYIPLKTDYSREFGFMHQVVSYSTTKKVGKRRLEYFECEGVIGSLTPA